MQIIAPQSTLISNLLATKQLGLPSDNRFWLNISLRSSIPRWQIILIFFPLQCLYGIFLKKYLFLENVGGAAGQKTNTHCLQNYISFLFFTIMTSKKLLTSKNLDDPIDLFFDNILLDVLNFSLVWIALLYTLLYLY